MAAVEDKVKQIIVEQLQLSEEEVTPEASSSKIWVLTLST